MKAYLHRRYTTAITHPTITHQLTMVGCLIRRTIGKGILNAAKILSTEAEETITTETGAQIICQSGGLPVRTFRVRRGNGYYATKIGELIQDQYDYNVADPNADHVGDDYKLAFAAAVAAWQALTETEKQSWNYEAHRKRLNMSGYNYFLRDYLLHQTLCIGYLKLETGDLLLQEDICRIKL
jgi:hypothetical protein